MSANGIANGIGSRCGRRKAGVGRSLALVAGLWALVGAAMATQAREFRAADIQDESYPTVLALRFMDQLVTAKTGGRHRMRIFHSRQLGEESQTIEQTRVGAIDMNRRTKRKTRTLCRANRSCRAFLSPVAINWTRASSEVWTATDGRLVAVTGTV